MTSTIEDNNVEQYDVVIIGGSFSGLSLGLFLGNAMRKVLIIDAHSPRNEHSDVMYNLIGRNETKPSLLLRDAKAEILLFEHVTLCTGMATDVTGNEKSGFKVRYRGSETLHTQGEHVEVAAKRVVFASGVKDVLPQIEGIETFWPEHIFHCPYCIAYGIKGLPVAIYSPNDEAYMMAKIINKWTGDVLLLTENKVVLSLEESNDLERLNVTVNTSEVLKITGDLGDHIELHLATGECIQRRGLFIHLPFHLNNEALLTQLGLAISEEGLVQVDEQYETSKAGVYAIGDMVTLLQKVSHAIHSGNAAGFAIDHSLSMEVERSG
ncbi:NAD(P)/FAD-dependent oxidoreductase [uncultured Shewanella sp.]|uniref:NAD(P)/FAD-dependent oxidoreductase n=1 Tax=uncultured Shewanella sp. TaxID=173975 RepID=UPI0026146C04|nr:NAD(P)/FAD-dependent oxidoreductase [uncultured Shewanella sp.]